VNNLGRVPPFTLPWRKAKGFPEAQRGDDCRAFWLLTKEVCLGLYPRDSLRHGPYYGALGALLTGHRLRLAADAYSKTVKHYMLLRQDMQISSFDFQRWSKHDTERETIWL
jgi:hypothetical protein